MMFDALQIESPKRNRRLQTGWEGFFPYYAGYPESFARSILEHSALKEGSTVLDPWNGSGTTTYAAAHLGYRAVGLDLNPVMAIVSRARTLPFSEIDSFEPLSKAILQDADRTLGVDPNDPLNAWFSAGTVTTLRSIERSIREKLVGPMTLTENGADLQKLSSFAAAFYVTLFAVSRALAKPFQATNPTWLKNASDKKSLIKASRWAICTSLLESSLLMTP